MRICVPKERGADERRVALVPKDAAALAKKGARILVEAGAGLSAFFEDSQYADSGAEIASREEVFSSADLRLGYRSSARSGS